MMDNPEHASPKGSPNERVPNHDATVQELTWALLDDQIKDDEFRLLENLLLSDEDARKSYLNCVQLHADLMVRFAQPAARSEAKSSGSGVIMGLPFELQAPS